MGKAMTTPKKVKAAELPTFDVAATLRTDAECAAYLSVWLEDGTPHEIAAALGEIARARGMTQLAQQTGLSRESLYKGLSGDRAPSTETLLKVIRALGVRLIAVPA